jgi:uncharacterized membrane protein
MSKTDYLIVFLISMIVGMVIMTALDANKKVEASIEPMTHERIVYLKDSLEMEYYKNLLDETFFFEHSKIPENESDTGIQSTR